MRNLKPKGKIQEVTMSVFREQIREQEDQLKLMQQVAKKITEVAEDNLRKAVDNDGLLGRLGEQADDLQRMAEQFGTEAEEVEKVMEENDNFLLFSVLGTLGTIYAYIKAHPYVFSTGMAVAFGVFCYAKNHLFSSNGGAQNINININLHDNNDENAAQINQAEQGQQDELSLNNTINNASLVAAVEPEPVV
jgi:hypothetical protein